MYALNPLASGFFTTLVNLHSIKIWHHVVHASSWTNMTTLHHKHFAMTSCHMLYGITNTDPSGHWLQDGDCMQLTTQSQILLKVLAKTTFMMPHRLLPAFCCFPMPAGFCSFTLACLCFFTPGFFCFFAPMNSSSVDADVRISPRSKSSMSKLTGFWPCTHVPNYIWPFPKGNLRHCIKLRSSQLIQTESCTTKTIQPLWQTQYQIKQPAATRTLHALWYTVTFASSMYDASSCDIWYTKHALFLPKRSLLHPQFLQPLLPCMFQGAATFHVASGVQGIFCPLPRKRLWTCNTRTQQDHAYAAFPYLVFEAGLGHWIYWVLRTSVGQIVGKCSRVQWVKGHPMRNVGFCPTTESCILHWTHCIRRACVNNFCSIEPCDAATLAYPQSFHWHVQDHDSCQLSLQPESKSLTWQWLQINPNGWLTDCSMDPFVSACQQYIHRVLMQMCGSPQGQSHRCQSWLDLGPMRLFQNACQIINMEYSEIRCTLKLQACTRIRTASQPI